MTSLEEKAMIKKAKYIGCARNNSFNNGWKHTELFYEYRGHEYCIIKHNNGYMDKSLRKQHEEEQAKIDYMIEHENDEKPEWKYEGSAEEGFDIFWEYVNEQ